MKKTFLLSAFFIFASLYVSAQTPEKTPSPRLDVKTIKTETSATIEINDLLQNEKAVSGGVLNGKATVLPKPPYPAAARAVKASGAVSVQVLIDEAGNVIAAGAVSGHPLLRAASEEAARNAKFSPTTVANEPVKVRGIIVYNFVLDVPIKSFTGNWYQTGMMLSALQHTPTLRYFEPSALTMIPSDWTAELEQIKRLDELKKAEMQLSGDTAPKERIIDERTIKNGKNDKNSIKVTTTAVTVLPERKVSSEVTAIAQSLIASIQGRLAGNTLNAWYFDLGVNVNNALLNADSSSNQTRIDGVKPFREFIKNAPAQIPGETLNDLQKMAVLMEKGIFTDEDKAALTQLMMRLNTLPQN